MKKNIFIVLVIITSIIVLFLYFKIDYIYRVRDNLLKIEKSSLPKYIRLYDLTANRPLKDIDEFKNYIKSKDITLYKMLEDVDIQYLKIPKKDYGLLYLKGFDNKNDSLKKTYKLYDVDLLDALYVKGDIELEFNYRFENRKYNTIYQVGIDTINKVEKIDVESIYSKYLNCKKIKLKNPLPEDYEYINSIQVMMKKGKVKYDTLSIYDISKKSMSIIEYELKKRGFVKDSLKSFIVNFKAYSIEAYECDKDQ